MIKLFLFSFSNDKKQDKYPRNHNDNFFHSNIFGVSAVFFFNRYLVNHRHYEMDMSLCGTQTINKFLFFFSFLI